MSSLSDRQNSPRRRSDRGDTTGWSRCWRAVVLLYSFLPLLVFLGNGSWFAFMLTLLMVRLGVTPLRRTGDAR
jgi:hypothetical protein